MTFEEIEIKVTNWGREKGLLNTTDPSAQCHKLLEEYTELIEAVYNTGSYEDMIDALGDMLVVMTMISKILNTDLTSCYLHAYNEIKDRTGKTVNGIFVKD